MATPALLRSIRRHHVFSTPLSLLRFRAASGEPSLGNWYMGQNCGSLCRVFSSKPAVNDIISTGLGSTNVSDATEEQKIPKAFENAGGARTSPSFIVRSGNQDLRLCTPSFGTRRLFSTQSDDPKVQDEQHSSKKHSFRPLSPHLPVYQPQMNSMLSIFNRISGAYLTGVVLAGYLIYMKMGLICLTYPSFYQFLFHASKQIPFFISVTTIAMLYHVVKGTHSLMTHAKPFPKFF